MMGMPSGARAVLLGLLVSTCLLPLEAGGREKGPADLLVIGGQIRTQSGWVDAMAVRDGVIRFVGKESEARRHAGPAATLVDVHGGTVLPGLVDSHVHPLFAGLAAAACRLAPGAGAPDIQAAVRDCVARRAPGDWIKGGSWVAASLAPGQQTRALLDAVAPDNPVVLDDEALHSVWVNSLALRRAGIDRNTPDPVGGIIERDAAGEPTGLLRENATALVERALPPDSLAARRTAIKWAADMMLSHGITAFTVASIRNADIEPFAQLTREGLVKQRIRGCIVWDAQPGAQHDMGERLIAARADYTTDRFKPDCVKIFMDGVPTESHTGAMLHPYADHGAGDSRPPNGILMIAPADLNPAVARFDRMGLSVKFHAAGDAAVRAAIDAIAFARQANGGNGPIHAVGHSTFVDPADIPRVEPINAAWEFSPYIWYPTPIASVDIAKAVGAERMQRWMPLADALKTGALVVTGSDWPVIPSVNPWLALETLVTRERPGGGAEKLAPGQAISREQAFTLFTTSGARLMGLGDQVGALKVGMAADFIVIQGNPYSMPIHNLHETHVMMTFINGEKQYERSQ